MTQFSEPLRLHLDGDALAANWRALAKLSGKAATGAAVKANGYGLGAREVVARLYGVGCRDFFVAHWGEAEAIADLVPLESISVLNGIAEGDVSAAIALDAAPVLNTPQQIAMWKAANGGRCHVMLDSGINRLGIGPQQFSSDLFDGLDIDILMSHLASADENVVQNELQLLLFNELSQQVKAQRRSLSNSAGIMLGSNYHFDLTRPGLSLYGGIARSEMAACITPVGRLSARILQIRQLQADDPVGYNATFTCPTDMRVATAAIGYADGYYRVFSNKGTFHFGDHKLPLIGRVSMDLAILDISTVPQLHEGDWVDVDFDLVQAAKTSGMSQYELLTGLGSRSQRIWV
jgi:alanine racemase